MSDEKCQSDGGAKAAEAGTTSKANEIDIESSWRAKDHGGSNTNSNPDGDGTNVQKKKNNSWKFNKNQKSKRKPWYRNRGEKRQKTENGADNDDGTSDCDQEKQNGKDLNRKGKTKNERKKEDYGSREQTPHEGSFAHENMQKLFRITIEKPEEDKYSCSTNKSSADHVEEKQSICSNEGVATNTEEVATKFPKRKLAILVSFLGTKYSGFQINAEKNTLQAQLELALHRAGIINFANFGYPSKYSWSSSARTDKGVHAAAQVCSFKGHMIFHIDGEDAMSTGDQLDAMRTKVNEHLPDDIRIIDIERVTRNFCARTNRDKVRYQYMVPSFMLCSKEEVRKAFSSVDGSVLETKKSVEKNMTPMEASNIVQENITQEVLENARSALYNHRVTPHQLKCLRKGLKLFQGTHPFHNYTRRIGGKDASAMRYILSFEALDPVVLPGKLNTDETKQQDMEWIPVQIVGQSFLLNQIRKMISAAVDLGREVVSEDQIRQSLKKEVRMKVNVAPAQGLFLDRSYFDLYNKLKVKKNTQSGGGHDHDQLNWAGSEEYPAGKWKLAFFPSHEMKTPKQIFISSKLYRSSVKRIEEFKNDKIIPHIVHEEINEGNFLKYLFAQDILHEGEIYSLLGDPSVSKNEDDGSDEDNDLGN